MQHFRSLLVLSILAFSPLRANPAVVDGVRQEYLAKMEVWSLSMQAASSVEEQQKRWSERPDALLYAGKMWTALRPALAEEWSIEPAAWLLKLMCSAPVQGMSPEFVALRKEIVGQVMMAVEKHHLRSAKMAPMCLGLFATRDSSSLKLLEKIERENPKAEVQGVAALAIAMLLQDLSDDAATMQRRLTLIRKAIIESAHMEIDGVTVAKMAEDQLYLIQYLSKNRVAPDFSGVDVAGVAGKLSEYAGKVIVLLFWNSTMMDQERVLTIQRQLVSKMEGKPFVLIGVTNDPLANVRAMQADGVVTWRNFLDTKGEIAKQYRVQSRPICYVLDHQRKIQYVGMPGSFVELSADALLMDVK